MADVLDFGQPIDPLMTRVLRAAEKMPHSLIVRTVPLGELHQFAQALMDAAGATALMPPERIAMLWNSLPLETDPESVVAFVRGVERFHGITSPALPSGVAVVDPGPHIVPTTLPMFAVAVARRKWESLQAEGYRMQRIQFAMSKDGQEKRGSIDPWGKVLWEPDGVKEDANAA